MEDERPNQPDTRSSSPTHSHIAESSNVHVELDQSGSSSVTSEETQVSTTTAYLVPQIPVPASTPTAQSVVEGMNNLNLYQAAYTLGQLEPANGPTSSILSEPPTPMIHHAVTRIKSKESNEEEERVSTPKPKPESDATPPNEHIHEHSVWKEIAREDVMKGLDRVMQYAEDMVRIDGTKTAETYYSEMVAGVINNGKMKFDKSFLQ